MPYNFNIPQPNDELSQSQNDILQNFTALGAIAGNNSIGSQLNATVGFNNIILTNQAGSTPLFNNQNGEWSGNFTFPTNGAPSSRTTVETWQQFTQGLLGAAGNYQYPTSASILSLYPSAGTNPNPNITEGWSYLSSGILIKWGQKSVTAALTNIDLTNATGVNKGPNFQAIFNAQVTLKLGGGATSVGINNLTTSVLQVTTLAPTFSPPSTLVPNSFSPGVVYWVVIGASNP